VLSAAGISSLRAKTSLAVDIEVCWCGTHLFSLTFQETFSGRLVLERKMRAIKTAHKLD
jgi:hypothetical protein